MAHGRPSNGGIAAVLLNSSIVNPLRAVWCDAVILDAGQPAPFLVSANSCLELLSKGSDYGGTH